MIGLIQNLLYVKVYKFLEVSIQVAHKKVNFFLFKNNQSVNVAIKTYKVEPEKEQEDATRSEKFLEEACK